MIPENIKCIIDFTLGDGYISYIETGKRQARLKIDHSIKQREYLWHKIEVLNSYGFYGHESIQTRVIKGKEYQTVSYVTKVYPEITTAHKWMYNSGRKAIDNALIRQLDAKSLAYWFMDDGSGPKTYRSSSIVNGKRYTYKYSEPKIERYTLATYNCTRDELQLIQNWLFQKYNIITHVKLDKRAKTCLGAFLSIDNIDNKDIFRSIIQPYIIPSMKYKIEGAHTFKGIHYSQVETERENS